MRIVSQNTHLAASKRSRLYSHLLQRHCDQRNRDTFATRKQQIQLTLVRPVRNLTRQGHQPIRLVIHRRDHDNNAMTVPPHCCNPRRDALDLINRPDRSPPILLNDQTHCVLPSPCGGVTRDDQHYQRVIVLHTPCRPMHRCSALTCLTRNLHSTLSSQRLNRSERHRQPHMLYGMIHRTTDNKEKYQIHALMAAATSSTLTHVVGSDVTAIARSTSFKPCPVNVHTAISPCLKTPIPATLRSPATDAAEAGSQKIPSISATILYASSIF